MKHLDLFSGIGGFSLAARWMGWETVGFCEIDPYCQKVLRKHWPNVPIYEDVRKLDGEQAGPVDIISGGYPCQPFSVAGKRRGEADDRHLWPEFARLIREIGPRWVVGENVAGHINMGLDSVLSDLEGLGYTTETFVIPACAVGAKHRRDRVWIVAHSDGERSATGSGEVSKTDGKIRQRNDDAESGNTGAREFVADTSREGLEGRKEPETTRPAHARGSNRSCNATAGACWEPEPGICRVVDGLPNRSHRLRGLGNSIVPQVAEIIFRSIEAADEKV